MTASELWAPVPGFVGLYEVSTGGRVRSCTRSLPFRRYNPDGVKVVKSRMKTLVADKDGYRYTKLYRDGVAYHHRVARLVLSAFRRLPLPGEEACHENHDKADNSLSNLCWGTRQENEDQKTTSGRRPRSTVRRLRFDDAVSMRRRFAEGETVKALAAQHAVPLSTVYLVLGGKTWLP